MNFMDTFTSLDWVTIFDSLNWTDLLSGIIQGIFTVLAAIIALLAVLVGTRSTHRKNYNEWKWTRLFEALVEFDKSSIRWDRTLGGYVSRLQNGQTISNQEYERDINPILTELLIIRRQTSTLMTKRGAQEHITSYAKCINELIDTINEYNKYNEEQNPYKDETLQTLHEQNSSLALQNVLTYHSIIYALTSQDLRVTAASPKRMRINFRKMFNGKSATFSARSRSK